MLKRIMAAVPGVSQIAFSALIAYVLHRSLTLIEPGEARRLAALSGLVLISQRTDSLRLRLMIKDTITSIVNTHDKYNGNDSKLGTIVSHPSSLGPIGLINGIIVVLTYAFCMLVVLVG